MASAKTELSGIAAINAERVFSMTILITHGSPALRNRSKCRLSTAAESET
jgi:hypothetical protein